MDIQHLIDKNRFEITIDSHTAYVAYKISDGYLDIRHTIVPEELRGKGIASKLVKAAYDYAVENHLKCKATCSYAVEWIKKHPEYNAVVGEDYGGDNACTI